MTAVVLILAALVMILVPVVDYWPAPKVWVQVYWDRLGNWRRGGHPKGCCSWGSHDGD